MGFEKPRKVFGKRGLEQPARDPEIQARLYELDKEEEALTAFQEADGVLGDSRRLEEIRAERERLGGGAN